MSDLKGAVGEVSLSIEIKRKETGQVEHHTLVGFVDAAQRDALIAAGLLQSTEGVESHVSHP